MVARGNGVGALGENGEGIKKCELGPGWCGSVDGAPASEPKGRKFDSQSGHMPGLLGQVPGLGAHERQPHIDVSLLFLPSFPSKNKQI